MIANTLGTLDLFAPPAPPRPLVTLPGIERQAHVAHLSATPTSSSPRPARGCSSEMPRRSARRAPTWSTR